MFNLHFYNLPGNYQIKSIHKIYTRHGQIAFRGISRCIVKWEKANNPPRFAFQGCAEIETRRVGKIGEKIRKSLRARARCQVCRDGPPSSTPKPQSTKPPQLKPHEALASSRVRAACMQPTHSAQLPSLNMKRQQRKQPLKTQINPQLPTIQQG